MRLLGLKEACSSSASRTQDGMALTSAAVLRPAGFPLDAAALSAMPSCVQGRFGTHWGSVIAYQ
jgi:hypothetical protein